MYGTKKKIYVKIFPECLQITYLTSYVFRFPYFPPIVLKFAFIAQYMVIIFR